MHRVHLIIRGRVQGVGFRYFVARRAGTLAVGGWVRNLPDGTVELEAEGSREALERLLEAVREGPPGARVAEVHERWSEGATRHRGFQIGHGGMP